MSWILKKNWKKFFRSLQDFIYRRTLLDVFLSVFYDHIWPTTAAIPSFYMNVGHFSEYSGHPNNKFQTFLKNSRVQVGVYLWCTKICIFQSRFCTIFFKIFCSVFPEKFMKNHFHFANLFTGLGFSTCTFSGTGQS